MRYTARGAGASLALTDDALWFTVFEPAAQSVQPALGAAPAQGVHLRQQFLGANLHPRIEPLNQLAAQIFYLHGNDVARWHVAVPTWASIRYVELYPHIDLEITSASGQLIERLIARPGADLAAVRMRVDGAEALTLDNTALHLTTAVGPLDLPLLELLGVDGAAIAAPRATLYGNEVSAPFRSAGTQISAASTKDSDDEDSDEITLLYAARFGGSKYDRGYAISVDKDGAAYITGVTLSADLPTTPGAFGQSFAGDIRDVFVSKLNAAGTAPIYTTYIGGNMDDWGLSIAIDADTSAYITGFTNSSDFPFRNGAQAYGGGVEAFALKLNPSGSDLVYSTLIGGAADDRGYGIALDKQSAAYVVGMTNSTDFPASPNALDATCDVNDAFVVKLSPSGASRDYATCLGGSGTEYADGIAIDQQGAASGDAFDRSYNGGKRDIIVAKITSDGTRLDYNSFFGGSADESGGILACNKQGDVYATGFTNSLDFPRTVGAYNPPAQGGGDVFVLKLSSDKNKKPPKPTNTPTNTPTLAPGESPRPTFTPTRTPTRTPMPTATDASAQPTVALAATPTVAPGETQEPALPPPPTATPSGSVSPSPSVQPAPGRTTTLFLPMIDRSDPPVFCSDIEDNDTPAQAKPMSPIDKQCVAAFRDDPEGEDDYYSIALNAGQNVQVTLAQIPAEADYDLILYTANLAELGVSNRSGRLNEQVSYTATASGSYLILVNMARESTIADNAYALLVTVR